MSEVVATFCTTDSWHERADPAAQATNSLSQAGFEFAERHLDRIKVRRVLRQISVCPKDLPPVLRQAGRAATLGRSPRRKGSIHVLNLHTRAVPTNPF
jgi:hypothetical protein